MEEDFKKRNRNACEEANGSSRTDSRVAGATLLVLLLLRVQQLAA